MDHILIVEDDPKLSDILTTYAKTYGYSFQAARDGREALALLSQGDYDAILLDVMMPHIDGWSVLREIRAHSQTPVILLTARGEESDRLFGFELGADDYVVKPFSPKEVMARLKVVLRRGGAGAGAGAGAGLGSGAGSAAGAGAGALDGSGGALGPGHGQAQGHGFALGSLMIDTAARQVARDGKTLKMTPKEYDLLVFLASNRGRALTRQQILDGVWGVDFYGDDRTVDTHIKMLRENLGPLKSWVVTVWGLGYRFEPATEKGGETHED